MVRVLIIFVLVALIAMGAAWFADRPGELTVSWLGYEIETSFMLALAAVTLVFLLAMMLWTIARGILGAPGVITNFFRARRQARGLEALTRGVVAAGAGDAATASRYATLAHRSLGNTPLAQLLRAQAAQLSGDHGTVRLVFDDMLQNPDTEALGLRGLFVQAQQDRDHAKARAYAERALALNPRLPWAATALLAMQAAAGDWRTVEQTIDDCRRNRLMEASEATRKTAVAVTAHALALEETDADGALERAQRAHKLAPELVPAAVLAGRLYAAMGQPRKATKILEKTWKLSPHPDLAEIYGAAYTGRSPRDRLKRVKNLVKKIPVNFEGPIAIARAAVEAQDWDQAREALDPFSDNRPSARVCELMAEIAHGDSADEGLAREWLAKAIYAPRDPVWVADGYVSDKWLPCSPVTGELDAFVWQVPSDGLEREGSAPEISGGKAPPADTPDGDDRISEKAVLPAVVGTALAPAAGEAVSGATAADEASKVEDLPLSGAEDGPADMDVIADEPAEVKGDDALEEAAAPAKNEASDVREPEEKTGEDDDTESGGPKIFVPPRPPDDPGPEPRDEEGGNLFQALFAR